MPEHKVGTQEEFMRPARSCSRRRRSSPAAATSSRGSGGSFPGCRSRRSTASRPRTGTKSLAELFDGRSQLLIYHFMFGPPYEAGCTVCSSIADTIDPNAVHLAARDVTMLLVSRAPVEKLQAYKKRMGWGIEWVSAGGSDFNRDLGFTHTEEELRPFLEGEIPPTVKQMAERSGTDVAGYVAEGPGLSAYALSDGTVYRTYVTTARGLEPAMAYYGLLDRTPMGRDEGGDQPFWLRRHDEYETG